MSHFRRPLPDTVGVWAVLALALGTAACARVERPTLTPQPNDGGAVDTATTTGGPDAPIVTVTDARPANDIALSEGGTCTPSVTCNPPNGRYCGVISDGCLRPLDCGASCAANEVCDQNICVGDNSCVALTCAVTNGRYCGTVGNGCGRAMDCGACDPSLVCTSGVCIPGAGCVPLTCTTATGRYCGTIGDGCGGTLQCGDCPAGSTCAGAGLANTCAPTNCTPGTCTASSGARYCGTIGDGCGRSLDCGGCTGTDVCSANVCRTAGCVPLTCNAGTSRYCGTIGDGCGGSIDCGACTAPATCAGQGVANVCGDPNCKKITCTPTGGQYCGTIGDGCGGTLNCGACANGMACGTGTSAGVCPGSVGTGTVPPTCTGATKTTISGTVYDPAGKVPLYNVVMYVPSAALDPIPEGVSCDKCASQVSGHPIASALTDTSGHFSMTIEPVPSTTNVPLVIQVGKWRRQVTIPSIKTCQDNPITDVNLTRLPKTQSEGHIPRIALTTGGSDALECFLRKVGIADSEFTTETGTGRVAMYVGGVPGAGGGGQGAASFTAALGGASFPAATTLWASPTKLLSYDMLLMSCEGGQYASTKMPYVGNIKGYADAGGRLFNDHLHFYWLRNGPNPWPMTAAYIGNGAAPASPTTGNIVTTFPKGSALADWLVTVGGSTTRGQITLYGAQHSVDAVNAPTQGWITIGTATDYLTFNTPVEAAATAQCGRVVETDLHVKDVPSSQNGKDDSDPSKPFPSACLSTTLSAQEKALEFLFFDLSSCVQPDTTMPTPPPVPPPGAPTTPPPATPVPPPVPPGTPPTPTTPPPPTPPPPPPPPLPPVN
jgi:hypothetical protein